MWWKTKCYYCNKPILVNIPARLVLRNRDNLKGNACYRCVPENSSARDGCNECAWDIKVTYEKIRKNIEDTWPDWKIDAANEYIESVHGQKLRKGMQVERKRCDACDCWRWDKEYEYEYCSKDPARKRLPIYRPPWCPMAK